MPRTRKTTPPAPPPQPAGSGLDVDGSGPTALPHSAASGPPTGASTDTAADGYQDTQEVEARAEALRERIRAAEHAYYALDNPIMTDAEFDDLVHELQRIEAARPDSHHARLADAARQRRGDRRVCQSRAPDDDA